MRFLYDLFIRLYYGAAWVSQFFKPKAKKWIEGRKNNFQILENFAKQSPKNIWVHCASVGEFEQGLPVINALQKEFPSYKILVSFFSPSGYEYAKKNHTELHSIYLPIDTSRNAKRWYNTLSPKAVFFIKYEFWHHFIKQSKENEIPLYVVSAVFWKELFFFKKYGGFFRKSLRNIEHFFVQNEESQFLLEQIGITQNTVMGDTRYERVMALRNENYQNKIIEDFTQGQEVFMAGSVWNSDTSVLLKIIKRLPDNFKVILAPHEINHFETAKLEHLNLSFYSKKVNPNSKVLIIDILGILSRVYRYANLAYVGGGFGGGIHNILEPAVYNIPVMIGPEHDQFIEAKALQEIGIVHAISSPAETSKTTRKALSVPNEILHANEDYFAKNSKVSEQIIVFIKKQGILD
jgi:3-deoxy-D-manno-octulosonic-acid transferase